MLVALVLPPLQAGANPAQVAEGARAVLRAIEGAGHTSAVRAGLAALQGDPAVSAFLRELQTNPDGAAQYLVGLDAETMRLVTEIASETPVALATESDASTRITGCADKDNCLLQLSQVVESAVGAPPRPRGLITIPNREKVWRLQHNLAAVDAELAARYQSQLSKLADGGLDAPQQRILADALTRDLIGELGEVTSQLEGAGLGYLVRTPQQRLVDYLEANEPALIETHRDAIERIGRGEGTTEDMETLAQAVVADAHSDTAAAQALLEQAVADSGVDLEALMRAAREAKTPEEMAALAEQMPPEVGRRLRSVLRTSLQGAVAATSLWAFLSGVKAFSAMAKAGGSESIDALIQMGASNPLMGLAVGYGGTVVMQTSSGVTGIIVGLMGAGLITPDQAAFLILGANAGTTSTSTGTAILGYHSDPKALGNALRIGTVHDYWNLQMIAMMGTVEYTTGALSTSGMGIAHLLAEMGVSTGGDKSTWISDAIGFGAQQIKGAASLLPENVETTGAVVLSLLAVYGSLKLLSSVMKSGLGEASKTLIERTVGKSPWRGVAVGAGVTVATTSSSVSNAALVPLGAMGALTLVVALPIVMGTNIGTTVSTMIVALGDTGPEGLAAVGGAMMHFLANGTTTGATMAIKQLQVFPLAAAEFTGRMAEAHPRLTPAVIIVVIVTPVGYVYYRLQQTLEEHDDRDAVQPAALIGAPNYDAAVTGHETDLPQPPAVPID